MKLIVEEAHVVDSIIEEVINESTGKTIKNYYIEGIFSSPDKKNRNGRIYPTKLWETQVELYQSEIDNNTYNTLGEMEHPPRANVDPYKAVFKIEKLYMEGGFVKGRAKILNDGSEATNKIKALIDEGFNIGVSSRGVGRMGASAIVEDFKLITFDAVGAPSDYNANLSGIVESNGMLFSEGVLENQDFMVCGESGCVFESSLGEKMKAKKEAEVLSESVKEIDRKELDVAIISKFEELLKNFNK
jgi:hypothetical protein